MNNRLRRIRDIYANLFAWYKVMAGGAAMMIIVAIPWLSSDGKIRSGIHHRGPNSSIALSSDELHDISFVAAQDGYVVAKLLQPISGQSPFLTFRPDYIIGDSLEQPILGIGITDKESLYGDEPLLCVLPHSLIKEHNLQVRAGSYVTFEERLAWHRKYMAEGHHVFFIGLAMFVGAILFRTIYYFRRRGRFRCGEDCTCN